LLALPDGKEVRPGRSISTVPSLTRRVRHEEAGPFHEAQ
jgi:hypothetical protein